MHLFECQDRGDGGKAKVDIGMNVLEDLQGPTVGGEDGPQNGQDAAANQTDNGGLQAGHHALDGLALFESIVDFCHNQDDDKGGHHHAEGGESRTEKACHTPAHEGGGIDRDRAGGGLGNHRDFHHFVVGDPLLFVHANAVDHRDHSIAAAKGERTDLQEGQEQRQQPVLVFHDKEHLLGISLDII